MKALIEALPALFVVIGFLIVLTRIGTALNKIAAALNKIAAALDYANVLTRDAWQAEYKEGRIEKPSRLRRGVLG